MGVEEEKIAILTIPTAKARGFDVKMAKTRRLVDFLKEPTADDSERDVARPSENRRNGAALRAFETEHKKGIINP